MFVFVNNNPEPRTLNWADYAEITGSLKGIGRVVTDGSAFKPENCVINGKSSLIVEFK